MKKILLAISTIFLFSCSPQKNVSNNNALGELKTSNNGMKMYGKVVVKSKTLSSGKSETPVLYFDNGLPYIISLTESKVSEKELRSKVYQEIDIVGEIKTGQSNQNLKKKEETTKEDGYIVIYKIL